MPELNWACSFNEMGPIEDADFISQLLENNPFFTDCDPSFNISSPSFWPSDHSNTNTTVECSDAAADSSLYCWPQWNSSSLCSITTSDCDAYSGGDANVGDLSTVPIDVHKTENHSFSSFSLHGSPGDPPFEDVFHLNEERSTEELGEPLGDLSDAALPPNQIEPHKRKMQAPGSDDTSTNTLENPKKKSRVSPAVQRNPKSSQSRKNLKTGRTAEDEETNNCVNGQSSSSCSSEDDSHASQEPNGANQNGKTRAGRGAATDPQSLYARKRRERINERLRILQNLVPNGTKVDISTMLEEAVQYVKFLQLQIKGEMIRLSSNTFEEFFAVERNMAREHSFYLQLITQRNRYYHVIEILGISLSTWKLESN
ncbi:hypothetical protein ACLOJK_035955 [Asimina triloba]